MSHKYCLWFQWAFLWKIQSSLCWSLTQFCNNKQRSQSKTAPLLLQVPLQKTNLLALLVVFKDYISFNQWFSKSWEKVQSWDNVILFFGKEFQRRQERKPGRKPKESKRNTGNSQPCIINWFSLLVQNTGILGFLFKVLLSQGHAEYSSTENWRVGLLMQSSDSPSSECRSMMNQYTWKYTENSTWRLPQPPVWVCCPCWSTEISTTSSPYPPTSGVSKLWDLSFRQILYMGTSLIYICLQFNNF